MKRAAHLSLIVLFLVIIYSVPLFQGLYERIHDKETPQVLDLFKALPRERHLRTFEHGLEEASVVAQTVRPLFQLARWVVVKDMGEKAVPGRRGWYFYQPELRYLGEPYYARLKQPEASGDPVEVIVDFARQLSRRGVRLLVIPVPSKPSIYPDRLLVGPAPQPALSANTQRFIAELHRRGIDVVELHPIFAAARHRSASSLYLAQDTHWSGETVKLAASVIAARIRALPLYGQLEPRTKYQRRAEQVFRHGDIPRMTRIPKEEVLFPGETTTVYRVFDGSGKPYEDSDAAPVLLLGDSFCRIYETDEPGAAGLIANLAYELGVPLSSIVNDGGASTLVRQELARDTQRLKGKKLLLWVFAERDVRFGMQGWQRIDLSD